MYDELEIEHMDPKGILEGRYCSHTKLSQLACKSCIPSQGDYDSDMNEPFLSTNWHAKYLPQEERTPANPAYRYTAESYL